MTQLNMDLLGLNREVAYSGKMGRRREKPCTQDIKHKKVLIARSGKTQNYER